MLQRRRCAPISSQRLDRNQDILMVNSQSTMQFMFKQADFMAARKRQLGMWKAEN
jgi:hypothetical protein